MTRSVPARVPARPLSVNLFEMNTVGHISHGLWAHPRNDRSTDDLDFWIRQARLLEEGLFDAVFLADVLGTYDSYRGGPETALREAVQVPNGDPLLVVPAMAAATRHLGFVVTSSTTYEPPFAFARRISTLDHLTRGRLGWNVVTSYLPNAARNAGLDGEIDHATRYAIAEEYLDVLYKLWEGSWDDDAVVGTPPVHADPAKVRRVDHHGRWFSVEGPHLCRPSRQRTPVLFQAGSSPAGIAFAARHAEAVFVGGSTLEAVGANVRALRRAAEENGRDPRSITTYAMATIIAAADRSRAEHTAEELQRYTRAEGYLAHAGGGGLDLAAHPHDRLVEDAYAAEGTSAERVPSSRRFPPGTTVGQALREVARFDRGPFFALGGPTEVADAVEEWARVTDVDGLNLRQFLTPGTAEDFVTHAVPELQRRGLYRTAPPEGTLRERLAAPGSTPSPRLPENHPGARYRGGAHLGGGRLSNAQPDAPQADSHLAGVTT